MNAFEVKVYMLENGLKIATMAEKLANANRKKTSLQTMISDMVYGRAFYPALAKELQKKFGLKFERPAQFEPVSEVVKQAA